MKRKNKASGIERFEQEKRDKWEGKRREKEDIEKTGRAEKEKKEKTDRNKVLNSQTIEKEYFCDHIYQWTALHLGR